MAKRSLGRAIGCKNAEAHGGTIVAESPPEGGACLRFTSPLARPDAMGHAHPSPAMDTANF